jgi:SAM-dependent MidA family methyltransferase
MPVRLISDGTEKLVGFNGENFVFVERPVEKAMFNQAALDWMDEITANLQRGYVIAIDYGCTDEDFRRSVQVRAQHRNLHSPFDSIGEADITMSVDWRSIVERAQANGLRVVGFTDQHHFLTGIISQFGTDESPEPPAGDWAQSPLPDSRKAKRELQTLLHPEMLGRAFQVLALAKNVAFETNKLAGFKFVSESSSSLSLGDSIQ